jgi:hypothetical protein
VAQVLGVRVVEAFNNIIAPSLAMRGVAAGAPARIGLSGAGDGEWRTDETVRTRREAMVTA